MSEQKVFFSKAFDYEKWPEQAEHFVIIIPKKFWSIKAWKLIARVRTFVGDLDE